MSIFTKSLDWFGNVLKDTLQFPPCFVAEAAEERWEAKGACEYEGAFWEGCDSCTAREECEAVGKACKGEDNCD